MNRSELQRLARIRIAEADALLQYSKPMPDGAYYLAGYAVECGLKACIAKLTRKYDFPDKQMALNCYTHNLDQLLRHAGLELSLGSDSRRDPLLAAHWSIVTEWNETCRYERHSLTKARQMVAAVVDGTHGVLPWIMARW